MTAWGGAAGHPSAPAPAVGIYVHFPYCRRRCPYCDFEIHVRRNIRHHELAGAVCRELSERSVEAEGRRLVSIYFGGGTPSLWEPASVAQVIEATRAAVSPQSPAPEVTLEANPDDLPPGRLPSLASAGVNRVSLGAQSFDEGRLRQLGRLHGAAETRRAVEEARRVGFRSLSLDLIFGLPAQTAAELHDELDQLLALSPDHVSAYQLTVEEHTPFGAFARRGQLDPLAAAREAELYAIVEERLGAAGFQHYEVSSWARPDHRAVHNALYWSGGEWVGLGPSAHSFRFLGSGAGDGGERRANPRHVDHYIERWLGLRRPGTLPAAPEPPSIERLGPVELAREAMWLGLRQLADGVDRAAFAARFGDDPARRFATTLAPLVEGGLLVIEPTRVRLTARGALLADEVGLRFL